MRKLVLLGALLLLAGCGTSSASTTSSSGPTPTTGPTPNQTVISQPGARWSSAPVQTIDPAHHYTATVSTNDGTFRIQLLPKIAPVAVNSFVFLARHNFFDNNPFHRILQHFMVQTGDPTGQGYGGPGYVFKDEISKTLQYTTGTVAMANSGHDTNGSQFFIVTGAQGLSLPPNYTIFGKVSQGMNVVFKIANTPVTYNTATNEPSQPLTRVYIKHVTITDTP